MPRQHNLAQVIGSTKVEHSVVLQNFQLLILTSKDASEWLILHLHHNTISNPLPEFNLRCPELFAIMTNHKRCSFLSRFLLILSAHFGCPPPDQQFNPCLFSRPFHNTRQRVHAIPRGEASMRGSIRYVQLVVSASFRSPPTLATRPQAPSTSRHANNFGATLYAKL